MGKQTKFIIPKGQSRIKSAFPKISSHGTFRCQRKPNSPLCK